MSKAVPRLILTAMCSWTALCAAHRQWSVDSVREAARANALVQAGKAEEAIPIYRSLAASGRNEPSLQMNLVVALYKAGRYEETAATCDALLKTNPDLFPAWLFLGASRSKLGDAANAEEPLRKAIEIRPNDPNAEIMLADVLSARGHNEEAAALYRSSAASLPGSPRPWYGLHYSYERLARDLLSRLQSEAQGSAEALALSAEFEFSAAQMVKAFQHLRQALSLEPGFVALHARIAAVYEETGNSAWAAKERPQAEGEIDCPIDQPIRCEVVKGRFQEAIAVPQTSAQGRYWQGLAFLALSQQAYDRLNALGPTRESYQAKAETEESRGRYPEAVTAWKEALQLDPKDALLRRRLALAFCHSNDCASALPLLKLELLREPSSAELNYLCGLALVEIRKPQQAIPYLEAAVRLDDSLSLAKSTLGEAYLEAGKPEQAIPKLQSAGNGDDTGARHYQLARAYRELDLREQSDEELRKYREMTDQSLVQSNLLSITPP